MTNQKIKIVYGTLIIICLIFSLSSFTNTKESINYIGSTIITKGKGFTLHRVIDGYKTIYISVGDDGSTSVTSIN